MLARSVLRLGQNLSIGAIDFFSFPLAFAWRLLASSRASRPSSVGCSSRPWAVGRLSQPAPSQLRLSRREAEPERPPARSFLFSYPRLARQQQRLEGRQERAWPPRPAFAGGGG